MLATPITEARANDNSSAASHDEDGGSMDAEGKLYIDYGAAKRLYPDHDLLVLTETAKGGVAPPYSSGTEGIQEYVSRVVKGFNPFTGLVDIDWELLYTWVTQRNWGVLTHHLGREASKRAAKVGIRKVVKLSPWGITMTLVTSAIACIFWQQ